MRLINNSLILCILGRGHPIKLVGEVCKLGQVNLEQVFYGKIRLYKFLSSKRYMRAPEDRNIPYFFYVLNIKMI